MTGRSFALHYPLHYRARNTPAHAARSRALLPGQRDDGGCCPNLITPLCSRSLPELGDRQSLILGKFGRGQLGHRPSLEEETVYTLDEVLTHLHRHHQRATYGAVVRIVDRPATFLMGGRPRDHLHSWVVNQKTHLPTGYKREQMHPALTERDEVISDPDELAVATKPSLTPSDLLG
jgi:hypothetical protein